ncbi:hypothetical protein ACFY91_07860 [Streptomyces albogriseolus]|uniref:hypothetical protein n=1 Tax=Streptomyces albogriseolus TaxID=1887 RepID=UPI0036E581A8
MNLPENDPAVDAVLSTLVRRAGHDLSFGKVMVVVNRWLESKGHDPVQSGALRHLLEASGVVITDSPRGDVLVNVDIQSSAYARFMRRNSRRS